MVVYLNKLFHLVVWRSNVELLIRTVANITATDRERLVDSDGQGLVLTLVSFNFTAEYESKFACTLLSTRAYIETNHLQ